MEGDLNSAEIVSFRYDNFDILCLEMLILEDENNELHIIQVVLNPHTPVTQKIADQC